MPKDPWFYFAWARYIILAHIAEEITSWGEAAMRGLQKDKKCEIAIRCRVVEIEKNIEAILKRCKISE